MGYTSDGMKKAYGKQCKEQRIKNLIKLRVDIAKMPKQVDFQHAMGFTKSDLSNLESGDKPLSLFHIHAYKTYFKDNFGIDVSVDFLMGYTDIIENQTLNIGKETGLSNDAIEMLKILTDYRCKNKNFLPGLGADIDAINILLEYQYTKTKQAEAEEDGSYYPAWSVLHFIRQYLSSGIYEREQQDRLRICDGELWLDIEKGDFLVKGKKKYAVLDMEAINSKSHSGSNTKKMNVVNIKNENERYAVEVNQMFQSYSRDNILKELDKIKVYIEEKGCDKK